MPLTPEQEQEIAAERGQTRPTRRATVPALEEILFEALPVLDHGFIRVIDYMGDDGAIVQAARVSYGRGTRRVSEDRGLINYLMRHRHTTPFEMCEIKYHVKLPIFVARQWIRHRTANVNEYSARYSILDNEFYIPAAEHLAAQATVNRQGRGDVIEGEAARRVLDLLRSDVRARLCRLCRAAQRGRQGRAARSVMARPRARIGANELVTQLLHPMVLEDRPPQPDAFPLACAPTRTRNTRSAYTPRRCWARVERWVPLAYAAFLEYRMNAATISATGLAIIRRLLAGEAVDQASSGLSAREWRELMAVLGRS